MGGRCSVRGWDVKFMHDISRKELRGGEGTSWYIDVCGGDNTEMRVK
jgi:hypothetical protein